MHTSSSFAQTKIQQAARWLPFFLACAMQIAAGAQQTTNPGPLKADSWESMDTLVTFDPGTYEEKVQIVKRNHAPLTGVFLGLCVYLFIRLLRAWTFLTT